MTVILFTALVVIFYALFLIIFILDYFERKGDSNTSNHTT